MEQKSLWQDGYTILQVETGAIKQTRLKRFLNWLDKAGYGWTEPHLNDYADYLRNHLQLHRSTIFQNVTELREHYLAILSNSQHYEHIDPDERAEVINTILEQLGFNVASINFDHLAKNGNLFLSQNMQILRSPGTSPFKSTQLTEFIYWLDNTGRHWLDPDLLDYKEFLMNQEGATIDGVGNSINAIRRRYYELVEDGSVLEPLSDDVREEFLADLRKRLGYLDQFPSRALPVRDMLEDDPNNRHYLTTEQAASLLLKPDTSTFVGVRDRALIGLGLATAVQQFEIANIQIGHLRHTYKDQPALFIPESKQRAARYIPYDDHIQVLDWIDDWLKIAEIHEGPVFRGTYGNRDVLRPHGIAPETASDILARYPIEMHGTDVPLLFGDLRAICARRWYDSGMSMDEIERRLGVHYRRATLKLLGLRIRRVFGG